MAHLMRWLALCFGLAALASCGKSGGLTPPGPTSPPGAATGTARITLSFSTGSSSASAGRRTQSYISSKTKSVGVFVMTVDGKPPAPSIAASIVDVGPGAANCTTSGSTITCRLPIALPAGSVGLGIRTYPLPSASFSTPGNVPLSIGSATVVVAAGQTVDAPVNLLPVVFPDTTAVISNVSPASIPGNAPGTATLTITAKDSAGDVIGGTDPYYQPIVVTSADTGGHVVASPALPATITAPGQTITLTYDGKGSASFFIPTFSVASDSVVNGISGNLAALGLTQNGEHVYVSSQQANAVYVYAAGPTASNTALRTIAGPKTTLAGPTAVAVDKNGALYVVNYQRDVTVFAPGADGDVAPIMTFAGGTGHPESIELVGGLSPVTTGPTDVIDQYRTTTRAQFYNDIYQPAPAGGGFVSADSPASGLTARSQSPQNGQVCWLQNPPYSNPWAMCTHLPQDGKASLSVVAGSALTFRSDGLVAVARPPYYAHADYSIATYAVGTDGLMQVPAAYDLYGASTLLSAPYQIAFDKAGDMYVANAGLGSGQGRVTIYAPNANGNVAPLRVIGGFTSSLGVAVGP